MPADIAPADLSRTDAKRRMILDVASEVFLAQGYAATSMSEIAAKLGGSKGTLYNYFRSKEELFSAFITEACQGRAAAFFDPLPPIGEGRSVRESLIELGFSLLSFLQTDELIAVHRVIVAEVGRFPEIGRMFYEAGPQRGEVRFAQYFRAAMEAGRLPPDDPAVAGQRLKDLVLSDVYLRMLWGVLARPSDEALREHVEHSVDIFLRAFGPALA
ncbi:MAG TPA: TetR/AcrR family transcriptional regulator [Caulobacteraceae bacterium]|jgi:AcrR family transcriptional regulator|nr:TetR/AcrR family transcriptional regulator [Caulobacteraceae bacterium]